MTYMPLNRIHCHLSVVASLCLLIISLSSCTEVWTLQIDDDHSDVAHTLCVAANATITGGELSFAAAVAPVRSTVMEMVSYPMTGLHLELEVDGETYKVDSFSREPIFGCETGFKIDGIPVERKNPTVAMVIKDTLGYYNTASASATAIKSPDIHVEVTSTKIKKREIPWVTFIPANDHMDTLAINSYFNCDSTYAASITINDPPSEQNYYMITVEFECFNNIRSTSMLMNKNLQIVYTENGLSESFGDYDKSRWSKTGNYWIFTSEDPAFFDEKIKTSIHGYNANFCNVFDDTTFNGTDKTLTIYFDNLFPQICKALPSAYDDLTWKFSSNAETPFHIYVTSMTKDCFKNYKSTLHNLSSNGSIFGSTAPHKSNIDGGIGYFSVFEPTDYFYYDDKICWIKTDHKSGLWYTGD